jgi:hypothetical protein
MKRYEMKLPRTAFGLAAAALTALTIGVAVVWPANAEADRASAATLTAAGQNPPILATIVSDAPHVDRIDVVAVRQPRMSVRAIYLRYAQQG